MMTDLFRIILLTGVLLYIFIIIFLMRKDKMNLKYSLVWFLSGIVLLICGIFPQIIIKFSKLIGVYSEVNVVFFLGVCFLLIIILSLTSIVSCQGARIRSLTQTQGMLEKRVRDLEKFIEKQEDKK